GAFGDHYSSPSDGSLYPPGRRTIAAKVRSGLAELREASAPMALMACRVFAIAVRSNHQRHDKPPMIAKQVTSSALNACNFASSTPAPLAQRLERSCCFVARTKLTCRMRGVGRVDSKLLANLLSYWPS